MKRKLQGIAQQHRKHLKMTHRSVELNPVEKRLRGLLLDVAQTIDSSTTASEPVTIRWAGGWVRDKLLGIESHDIDVAINTMTGSTFANHMREYCTTTAAIEKHQIRPEDVGSLHIVKQNPDQSKHLETAMVRLFGLDLDFVNLRKETYAQDSRNPQMEFGTAEEDALRRDATINALFYNLHADKVEDFTGGLADLDAKKIRTPLEPFQTFTDDPLRVLRLVRFASRLGFSIDPETERFMGDSRVLEALKLKISRERVGVELEKMLKGKHPRDALELIDRLGLYGAIFCSPTQETSTSPDTSRWPVAYGCLDEVMKAAHVPGSICRVLAHTPDAAYFAWNLCALSPWMMVEEPPSPTRKAKSPPPVAVIAREGYRAPNKLTDVISASYRHRIEITDLKRAVDKKEAFTNERDRVGMAIRKWDADGGSWRLQVLSAMLVEAMEKLESWSGAGDGAFLESWQEFLDHLSELDVLEAPSLKRLLDGKALAKALGTRPGKWTGKALDVCVAWQLRNPQETDPAGAVEEVRQRHEELEIPISSTPTV
ncbi:hypothetical protein S7711_01874 [Stachybotrys chartarum IBT 7711]|uniref:Poly A polymerase head domain-containing protein n=1 Tax=Stachybotrys chartarum (strain CBS 109288 / IBT 7711) TaxID=1280523 RepID=A0A084AMQ1_STACB|nr:hypothetical protein S7711_01874 [Stachybotrys chartarum IBT 7711]